MDCNWLSAENILETLLADELSLNEDDSEDGEDIYGYLGEPILRHNEIEAESRLLVQEDLGRNDLDEFEDTDKDYMYNNEESVHVARSEDSDNIDSHSETGSRSSSLAGVEAVQDEEVGEIILFEYVLMCC